MKCRRHPHEVGDGVCASCVGERLVAVVAARSASPYPSSPEDHQRYQRSSDALEQPSPPSLPLPPSVLPNVSPRRSDALTIGRSPDAQPGNAGDARLSVSRKLSFLSTLFGQHRSDGSHREPGAGRMRRSRSWLSTLIQGDHGRKKNTKKVLNRFFSADNTSATADAMDSTVAAEGRRRASRLGGHRGMSPDRSGSPESGHITDPPSPVGRPYRPTPSPIRRHTAEHQHHFGRGLAGFTICLNPLMRPSSIRWRCHAGAETSSGDIPRTQSPLHPLGQTTVGRPSLRPNRSRKLADMGKLK